MHISVSSYKLLTPIGWLNKFVLPSRNMATKVNSGKINVNTKHLSKGDPFPPYTGKLRVYNMRYCPFAQRAILALNAKNIDYEVVNINLFNKPEWLFNKNPMGLVPVLELAENVCIYESLIVAEYLDEAYPQRPLLPKDPLRKAQDKILIEHTGPFVRLYSKVVRDPDSINEEVIQKYQNALNYFENQLKTRGTKYLGGDEPGYVDYMNWPWFERLKEIVTLDERTKIDSEKYPLLTEYIGNMLKDPLVSSYLVPKEILFEVMSGYKPGKVPNYDLLLEE